MKILQKGGYVLETEEAFFEWLEKDSNIEDLLKSTLQFLEYKTKVANALVKDSMDELNQYWKNKLMTRIQTTKTVQKSFDDALLMIKADSLSKAITEKKDITTNDIRQLTSLAYSVQGSAEAEGKRDEGIYLSRISAQINQTQTLKDLYMTRKKEICVTYFAKKTNPQKYKEALQSKRTSIREKVNQFIESFTGESNRRHRLYILNYAIDFAQNWTSFQGNYKLNLLITGGAGLGKTTFAKAIGKLFFEFGFLARDLFQIREKTDFIGQYIGQTPMKTYSTLYNALESMVFIDEAYSVSGCGGGSSIDYGQEFIDALVDVSQKTRGLISIVAAGYKAEMHNCFLDKNPGMRRRFPNELELTPYSSIDLDNILTNNVLRPIFPLQLNSVLKTDLLKEPEIYFQNPTKYREFGKEILLRLPEFGRDESLLAFLQSQKQTGTLVKKTEGDDLYQGLLEDAKRGESLKKISQSKIQDYSLIFRYRTKIIGLYRFFMQLASFDTNFSSFESMYNAHQYLWNMITDNNPKHIYKYNNYRIMHLIFLSSSQQRREIMKSFLLRRFYSEKEGSLFPNQAGDMDTLAAFIKSQPNIRLNVMPSFEEVTKLYNEYFRSRGGSRFILHAAKADDAIELFIYHIGGGFMNYTDFEEGVLTKLLKGLTYDGKTVSALWNLNSQTPEHREIVIRKINSFYSQACVSLLQDAKESLKTQDSNEKNEKRLPSGIDIRFLEAEVTSFMGGNSGVELGDESKMKFLDYVSSGDVTEESEINEILNEITHDTESTEAPKSFSLNDAILCKDFTVPGKLEVIAPLQPVLPRKETNVPAAPKARDEEREKALRLVETAAAAKKPAALPPPLPAPQPAAPQPKATLRDPPPINPPIGDAKYPLKTLRVFIEERKRGPATFQKMTSVIPMTRVVGPQEIMEEYKLNVNPLPHIIPSNEERRTLLSQGYHFFLVEWTKGQGATEYRGQGFVYILKESKQCSLSVPLFKKKGIPKRFYEFTYLGRLDEIYPSLDTVTLGIRTFTKGPKPLAAPPGVPPLPLTRTDDPDKELKAKLDKIYPPSRLELATYKTKIKEGAADTWLDLYKKTKAQQYAQESGIDLREPFKLYYHGQPIVEFSDLVGKELSFAKEYPEMLVASILSVEEFDDEPILTIEDEKGIETMYKIFKVEYKFGKGELPVMDSGTFYYGVKLTVENPLEYPLEFILLEIEEGEEDEEGGAEDLGEVEFGNEVALGEGIRSPEELYFIDSPPNNISWDALNNTLLYENKEGGNPFAKIQSYTGIAESLKNDSNPKEKVGIIFRIKFLNDGKPDKHEYSHEYMLLVPQFSTTLKTMPPPPWKFILYEDKTSVENLNLSDHPF